MEGDAGHPGKGVVFGVFYFDLFLKYHFGRIQLLFAIANNYRGYYLGNMTELKSSSTVCYNKYKK